MRCCHMSENVFTLHEALITEIFSVNQVRIHGKVVVVQYVILSAIGTSSRQEKLKLVAIQPLLAMWILKRDSILKDKWQFGWQNEYTPFKSSNSRTKNVGQLARLAYSVPNYCFYCQHSSMIARTSCRNAYFQD